MHFQEGNRLVEPSLQLRLESNLLRIDAHKPKLFGFKFNLVKQDYKMLFLLMTPSNRDRLERKPRDEAWRE